MADSTSMPSPLISNALIGGGMVPSPQSLQMVPTSSAQHQQQQQHSQQAMNLNMGLNMNLNGEFVFKIYFKKQIIFNFFFEKNSPK